MNHSVDPLLPSRAGIDGRESNGVILGVVPAGLQTALLQKFNLNDSRNAPILTETAKCFKKNEIYFVFQWAKVLTEYRKRSKKMGAVRKDDQIPLTNAGTRSHKIRADRRAGIIMMVSLMNDRKYWVRKSTTPLHIQLVLPTERTLYVAFIPAPVPITLTPITPITPIAPITLTPIIPIAPIAPIMTRSRASRQ